jgi:cell division protein FtsZ
VHEDANIFIGLVINEELGDAIKVTAIATGFGDNFAKGRRQSEDLKVQATMSMGKIDRDLPTFLRKRQQETPRPFGLSGTEDSEYDIPTCLRKRVD